MKKRITAILLLLSLSYPLCSQSLPDLISDLEEVSLIIETLESSNKRQRLLLESLQENETLKEQELAGLRLSIERQAQSYQTLLRQTREIVRISEEQARSYGLLSKRFKILTYCTVGIGAFGLAGWTLWALK